jgi:hypothetical protein
MDVKKPVDDVSSDGAERIRDFLARHGGPGKLATREETAPSGLQGWSEVYAADGHVLRCEWSRVGSREEMSFSERPGHLDKSEKQARC